MTTTKEELKAILPRGLEDLLIRYENEAERILKKSISEQQTTYLHRVLIRVKEVRECVKSNDAELAAWNGILMASIACRADMTVLWRYIQDGDKHLSGLDTYYRDKKKQIAPKWEEVQEEAKEIRSKGRKLSKTALAEILKRKLKLEDSIHTIRQKI